MTATGSPGRHEVQDRLLTAANVVTVSRLGLVPVMLVLLLAVGGDTGARVAALAVFVLAAATDSLDGALARRRDEVTRFGVVADPVVDKVLVGSALAGVAALGELPWWVVAVVLARELLVTAVRFALLRRGRLLPAAASGKAKTVLQVVVTALLLVPPGAVPGPVLAVGVGAVVAVTLASGAEVLVRAARRPG